MTISLEHIPTANNSTARPLRTHRQDVNECSHTTTYTPCGSPPRFIRDRSPPKQHRPTKAPRSISPGGSSSSSPSQSTRKVSWASTLEQSVMTRPKTSREDIPKLYYSKADERRFRREAENDCPEKDYAISKAVVVFGEMIKTYDSSIWSFPNCSAEATTREEFSFDDPAFWNGILTWS